MFVSIPYIIKVNRQKIVFDGYILKVTPTIGYTKEIQVTDIKACNILKNKTVVLMDEKSNVLCKYPKKLDKDNVIYYALKRQDTIGMRILFRILRIIWQTHGA